MLIVVSSSLIAAKSVSFCDTGFLQFLTPTRLLKAFQINVNDVGALIGRLAGYRLSSP